MQSLLYPIVTITMGGRGPPKACIIVIIIKVPDPGQSGSEDS